MTNHKTALGRALLIMPIVAGFAVAHTPAPFSSGWGQKMWDLDTAGYPANNTIPYIINPTRPKGFEVLPEGTTDEEIVTAIRNVFIAHENIPTSKLKFVFLGVDYDAQFSQDGAILVTLDFNDPGVQCVSSNYKVRLYAPHTGDYTFEGSGETVYIERAYSYIDYDIALCDIQLSIDGAPGTVDIGGILSHELGHMFGNGHSILQPTTMSGYGSSMGLTRSTLASDDQLALAVMYPEKDFYATTGTLDGVVVEYDEDRNYVGEVFGAHITIIKADTGEAITESITGVLAVDSITDRAIAWDVNGASGRYVISGLPPGDYKVRVDAYDGPSVVGSTGKYINLSFFDYDELGPRRDFGYVLDSTVYSVEPGQVTIVDDIEVGIFDPDFPNVDSRVKAHVNGQWRQPAVAFVAITTTLAIPRGINASPSDNYFIDGTDDVQLINPRWSNSGYSILVDAVVQEGAPIGAHNIIVSNEHGFSMIHGGLMIASGPPVIESVSPSCAEAGEALTIHGSNFTYDSLVYFNGLLASDLVVVSTSLITATATETIQSPTTVSILTDTGSYELSVALQGDIDGDGNVGVSDMLLLFAAWGSDPGGPPDFDGNGTVGTSDLLFLFANWGPCL